LALVFAGYRWAGLLVGGLAGVVPAFVGGPFNVRMLWLLALAAVLCLLATAVAKPYVQLAQRRPQLLSLDLVLSVALLWASDGALIPLFPFATGSLVLPAMLFGWRGALAAAGAFTLLDQATLLNVGGSLLHGVTLPHLSRFLLPPGLALLCFGLLHFWHYVNKERITTTSSVPPLPFASVSSLRDSDGLAAVKRLATPTGQTERNRDEPAPEVPVLRRFAASYAPVGQRAPDLPQVVHDQGVRTGVDLTTALGHMATNFKHTHGIDVQLTTLGPKQPLATAYHSVLLRLAQEALSNVQHHAHAQAALLSLRFEPKSVTLTVQDDGVGLLDGTYERPGVHALRAMRYRLAELDGQLDVFEGESGGVTVRGTLPLE
jgi:glucose-6-phosphate-specific signal transduction histidine kinase